MLFDRLIPTTLVGSYPQPAWLVDKDILLGSGPPRVRMREVWRPDADLIDEAKDDAALTALHDQERADIDIVGDGEVRRESYFNHFANALEGVDLDQPGEAIDRTGAKVPVPRVVGPITHSHPVEAPHIGLLKAHTDRPIKITLPGPFTMAQQAQNDYYPDDGSLAMAYAAAVNVEVRALFAAGVDIVQLDEPYVQARPEAAREYAVAAIDRALEGATGPTALHVCFGYGQHVEDKPPGYAFLEELDACVADEISIECAQPKLKMDLLKTLPNKIVHVGVLDLRDQTPETPELVAERIRSALEHFPAERLRVAPDCGMKYLPRDVAYAKMAAMVAGARTVRQEIE